MAASLAAALSGAATVLILEAESQAGYHSTGRSAAFWSESYGGPLIQPLTIGRSVHLHPAVLLGSVVVGNHALGVLGMIIAVPVATIVQETVRLLLEHRRLLASRVRPRTQQSIG